MFVRTTVPDIAIRLDSVMYLDVNVGPTTSAVTARLLDGSTVGIGPFDTQAEAQAVVDFLLETAGSVSPPGTVGA